MAEPELQAPVVTPVFANVKTSAQVAEKVTGKLLQQSRRRLTVGGSDDTRYPFLHLATWGPPKAGKSDLGLRARSHEIRLLGVAPKSDPFNRPVQKVLLPSQPLKIAYANFDRSAATVLANLPSDVDIVEEQFFLDEHGEPLFMPDKAQLQQLLTRFDAFLVDAQSENVDLIVLDGGTIVWDNVRELRLSGLTPEGETPGGEPRLLPRQYAPANHEMRVSVMQRLYGARAHTYLTRESGEKWSGQNSVLRDANGDPVLRADGWNKTGHYADMDGLFKLVTTPQGPARWYTPDVSIRPTLLGSTQTDPTFATLYKACYTTVPLLRREDIPAFERLKAQHGADLSW